MKKNCKSVLAMVLIAAFLLPLTKINVTKVKNTHKNQTKSFMIIDPPSWD